MGHETLFRPSSAKRIMLCPASLLATIGVKDTPKFESAEGSVAHLVHDHALTLRDQERAWDWNGRLVVYEGFQITVDAEMCANVASSIEWCLEYPGTHVSEARVDISRYTPIPGQSGSLDHRFIDREKKLLGITDLKYGKGVQVYAERNPQLALYALASLDACDPLEEIETVLIRISQPRLDHRDVWEVSVAELRAFGEEIKQAFVDALDPEADYGPHEDACQFCRIKDTCVGRAEQLNRFVRGELELLENPVKQFKGFPEDIHPRPIETLTAQDLSWIWLHTKQIKDYLSKVDERVMHQLMHGVDVPELKTVEGRGSRVWTDEQGAKRLLVEMRVPALQYLKIDFASPNQAEKLLPKDARKDLASFWRKNPGKPTVARKSDKRDVLHVTPATLFGEPTHGNPTE